MKAGGGGSVINVASMYGMVSPDQGVFAETLFQSSPAHAAAKPGLIQLARYAACELAKDTLIATLFTIWEKCLAKLFTIRGRPRSKTGNPAERWGIQKPFLGSSGRRAQGRVDHGHLRSQKKKPSQSFLQCQPKGQTVRWDCWPARRVSRLLMTGKSTSRSFWELDAAA
jgi:hypothetical protein